MGTLYTFTNLAQDSMLQDPVLRSHWFVVASSAEVLEGNAIARRLLGQDIVLWRDRGEVHAWQDLCIHRGAKLSLGTVRDACLVCPYHGWKYDSEGKCVHIPAQPDRPAPLRARANAYRAQERYGLVWVSVGEPSGELPEFQAAEDAAYRTFLCGPYAFEAKGPRLIENFLDVGHLAIVHGGLLGDANHAAIADYEVEQSLSDALGPMAQDIRILQPNPDGTGVPAEVSYGYQVHSPLTASFVKSHGDNRLFMGYAVTPIEDNHSLAWAIFAMNYGFNLPEEQLRTFQDEVTQQDKAIVESQRPELLPLDLQAELHLRSDRLAIAYRTWLKTTGLRYGIA